MSVWVWMFTRYRSCWMINEGGQVRRETLISFTELKHLFLSLLVLYKDWWKYGTTYTDREDVWGEEKDLGFFFLSFGAMEWTSPTIYIDTYKIKRLVGYYVDLTCTTSWRDSPTLCMLRVRFCTCIY